MSSDSRLATPMPMDLGSRPTTELEAYYDYYCSTTPPKPTEFTTSRTERDPSGLSANQPGAKLDANKNRLDMVLTAFSRALWVVGEIGTNGALKYSENGWLSVPNGEARYADAMQRHHYKEAMEGELDMDSGSLHRAHRAWNDLASLELMLRRKEQETLAAQKAIAE